MSEMTGHQLSCEGFAAQLAEYLEGDSTDVSRALMEGHATHCAVCGALLAELRSITAEAARLPLLVPSRELWSGIADRIDARVLPLEASRLGRAFARPRRRWAGSAIAAAALVVLTAGVTHLLTRAALTTATSASPTRQTGSTDVAVTPPADPVLAPADSRTSGETVATTPAVIGAPDPVRSRRLVSRAVSPPAARATTAPVPARLAAAAPELPSGAEPSFDREIAALRRIVRERRSSLDPATIAVLEQSVAVIDSAIVQSRAALAKDPASGFLATQLNHSLEKKVELLRTAALLPSRT